MLEWNKAKVRNLTGTEIWLMIVGRVLAGFGLGILAVSYFPQFFTPLGFPVLLLGMILLVIAAKGLFRPAKRTPE
jgi:hypothetical protein